MPLTKDATIDQYLNLFGNGENLKVITFMGYPVYNWLLTSELIFDVLVTNDGKTHLQWVYTRSNWTDKFGDDKFRTTIHSSLGDIFDLLPPEIKSKIIFNLDLFV